MKNKILGILVCLVFVLGVTGCMKQDSKLGGDELLSNPGDVVLSIHMGNKACVPVQLTLYDDGTYELFTSYQSCRPGQVCTMMLKYTKSIKGKYDYDITKIIEDDSMEADKSHSMDNLPEYEIYMGNSYARKGYGYQYTVEKEKTNKYLEELLNDINVDLKVCAEPEYN